MEVISLPPLFLLVTNGLGPIKVRRIVQRFPFSFAGSGRRTQNEIRRWCLLRCHGDCRCSASATAMISNLSAPHTTADSKTVEIEGKTPQLIRVFPGIYMNPEEFETEKRPRQESNLRHQL